MATWTKNVTIIGTDGGIALGVMDSYGRLIKQYGAWLPYRDPDQIDAILRERVKVILDDRGEGYLKALAGTSAGQLLAMYADVMEA